MRTVARMLAVGVLCTTLLGCLPEGDLGDKTERVEQRRTAQAEGMARSLAVVGARALSEFTTRPPFSTATDISTVPTHIIADFEATFGLNLGPAGDMVSGGYCGDASADTRQSFIVWLTPTDGHNRFSPKGLGDGATGDVMTQLTRMTNPSSVGTADGNRLTMLDGNEMTMGTCGSIFNIPVGAPVMVFANLELAEKIAADVTRTETRVSACPDVGGVAQNGTITQTRSVTISPDGTRTEGAWTEVVSLNMCSAATSELATSDVADGNADLGQEIAELMESLDGGAEGAAGLADALGTLSAGEQNACKVITRTETDAQGQPITVTCDTCTGQCSSSGGGEIEQLEGVAALQSVPYGPPFWETPYLKKPCSTSGLGDSKTEDWAIPGFAPTLTGTWSATPWGPNDGAVYRRNIQRYQVTLPDGHTVEYVNLRGPYVGYTLNCNRTETVSFSLNLYVPNWAALGIDPNNLTLLYGEGVSYQREVTVEGWLNPHPPNYEANEEVEHEWVRKTLNAQWEEREVQSLVCPSGLVGARIRTRTHTLSGYRTITSTDWVISPGNTCQPPCEESTETRTQACPSSQTGTITQTRTVNPGGVCDTETAWTTTSNTCCAPTTETQDVACPAGQTGVITQTRDNCCGGVYGPWTQSNSTCQTATTVNGACGGSNGGTFASAPSGGLCGAGTLNWIDQTGTDGAFNWSCAGSGTPVGSTASCSAAKATTVNGACGGSNGATFLPTAPSSGLCDAGTLNWDDQNGNDGAFNWTCAGSGTPVGSPDSCSATKATTVNGACGSSNTGTFPTAPNSGLCDSPTAATWIDQTGTDGTFEWSCAGSGTPAGTDASCTANKAAQGTWQMIGNWNRMSQTFCEPHYQFGCDNGISSAVCTMAENGSMPSCVTPIAGSPCTVGTYCTVAGSGSSGGSQWDTCGTSANGGAIFQCVP